MAPRGHAPLHRLGLLDVDDRGKEEGLAVLAAEVAGDDVVEVGEVGFAALKRCEDLGYFWAGRGVKVGMGRGKDRGAALSWHSTLTLQPKILDEFR